MQKQSPAPADWQTELERGRAFLRFLTEANALIARVDELPSLYQAICKSATHIDTRIVLAWVGLLSPGGDKIDVATGTGSATAYLDDIHILTDPANPKGQGPTMQAIRSRQCVVINDFATDPSTAPWRERARRCNIAASISIPLFDLQHPIGALMLYSSEANSFDSALVDLLVGLGENISHAITFVRQRQENRIAAESLRRSEAHYRLIAENITDVIWIVDLETRRFAYVSPSVERMRGHMPDAVMAQDLAHAFSADSLAHLNNWLQTDIAAWEAGTYTPRTVELEQPCCNGDTVVTEASLHLVRDADSGHLLLHGVSRDISERRDFTHQLEQSRLNLRVILDSTDETIAMIEADGCINAINRIGAARFGGNPQTIVGANLYALLPPEIALMRKQKIDEALTTGLPLTIEDQRNERWFRTRIYPITDDKPRVVIYAVDITDERAAEQRIAESEQRYRNLFENSISPMLIIDPADGRIVDANAAASHFYGWPPEALVGMSIHTINTLPAEKIETEIAAAHTEERNHFLFRHRIADGTLRDVEVFSGPIQIGDRSLLYSIVIDVSNQRRNTRRIQALLDIAAVDFSSLSEEEFLNRGLEHAEAVTNSAIGFLHFVNEDQETIELVTWTAGALRGCTAGHDSHYPISQAGIWADCFRDKKAVVFNDYPNYTAKHGLPEGHAHLQRLISVPVIEEGKVRMMIGVGNKAEDYGDADIETVQLIGNDLWRIVRRARAERMIAASLEHHRELNRKLEEAHNQLLQSEKMSSIGQLTAGVAHELNNPIGFVHSNLGTLESYLKDIFQIIDTYTNAESELAATSPTLNVVRTLKEQKDFDFLREDITQLMAESKDGLNRVKKIVQDLKDFSRVGEVEWQTADIHKGLDSTLNMVWNELKYKCTVTKHYAADLPLIRCLPSQLNQVFMNLLVNAAHAIATKGEITLTTRRVGDTHIQIECRDNGSGISPEDLKRIFDPFFTTKPIGKGTGLGLSIAWGIIGRHQGTIAADSTPGVGTTFTITLPIQAQEPTVNDTPVTDTDTVFPASTIPTHD
jgi:PAS domain S-box-containing protein